MEELWSKIEGTPYVYYISSLGRIKSFAKGNEKIFTGSINSKGYVSFVFRSNSSKISTMVHRHIATAFIPNPNNWPVVNHKNGIKSDNRIENLEWCTVSYNNAHSFRELGRKKHLKDKTGLDFYEVNKSCVIHLQYSITGEFLNMFYGAREAERLTGVSYQVISFFASGQRTKGCGFIWIKAKNTEDAEKLKLKNGVDLINRIRAIQANSKSIDFLSKLLKNSNIA